MQVHHITPGRSDKNIGKAINDLIDGLPEDDWICLRDIDTIPMHHLTFFEQCEAIANRGEYDLVGCMTNRLGVKYQLYKDEFSDDFDLRNHLEIGKGLYKKYGNMVEDAPSVIAGIMMLFPVRIWEYVGGFQEDGIVQKGGFFDVVFNKKVRSIANGRIGVAKGIYLFHLYRPWVSGKDIRLQYKHLER